MIGTIGNPVLVQSEGFSIKNIALIKQNIELLNIYLVQLLQSQYISEKFSILNTGNSQKFIALGQIRNLSITIPELSEQQKIANCLSSLDDLITIQTQKLATLKTHKKGLMQQLFPAEGETVPKLRFPEFRDNWHNLSIGKCFRNIGGTALEKYVSTEGSHHFISIGNYSKDGKYIDKGQRVECNETTKPKILNKNDLVIVLNDKTLAGDIIGSTLLIDENDKYIYNQRSERLVINSDLRPLFAWYMLNSETIRKEVFKRSQGGTQIYVNFPSVKAIRIYISTNEEEQEKIADCLSSIDDLITAQAQKLDALRTHKKGLMQQLFPAAEEVAG